MRNPIRKHASSKLARMAYAAIIACLLTLPVSAFAAVSGAVANTQAADSTTEQTITTSSTIAAERTSLAKATVTLSKTSFPYDGKAHKPRVISVELNGITLREGQDYTVGNPKKKQVVTTELGTYRLGIMGIGDYKGWAHAWYSIKRASIAKATMKLSKTTFVYDGEPQMPRVTLKLRGKWLDEGQDFRVYYSGRHTKPGTYKAAVRGVRNYAGKVLASYTIVPKKPSITSLAAHKNSDGTSGFIVSWKQASAKGLDFELRWSNNKAFKKADTITFAAATPHAKATTAALRVSHSSWLGKPVYVQVRSFRTVKDATVYSAWSPTKTVKLEK